MKIKKYITSLFVVLSALFVLSCNEQEIETYNGGNYLWFSPITKEVPDSTFMSFRYFPDSTKLTLGFEVNLIGVPTSEDMKFNIAIIDSLTTAPKENYELATTHIFRAGALKDTMYIRLVNTPSLTTDDLVVTFSIIPGEAFKGGMPGKRIIRVEFNDKMSKPLWWTNTVVKTYLGTYSDEKYTEFIRYTGISDFGPLNASERRNYSLQFKIAIEKHQLKEKDGRPMVVPVQ